MICRSQTVLYYPKRTCPRIHGFKMTNSIDHIVKSVIQMGPNFTSPESVKNIACIGQHTNKFEQQTGSPHRAYSKLLIKHEVRCGLLGPLRVDVIYQTVRKGRGSNSDGDLQLSFSNCMDSSKNAVMMER
jgi:hypothetical protein